MFPIWWERQTSVRAPARVMPGRNPLLARRIGEQCHSSLHPDSASFVQALYHDILNRTGGLTEAGYWQQQLDSGAQTRAGVTNAFLTSPEFYDDTVRNDYLTLLGRMADANGDKYFDGLLQSGQRTPATVVVDFLLTLEYFNRQMCRM